MTRDPESSGLPLVGAVILNYNGADLTAAAVESLRRGARQRVDILLIDNGSRDGSADRLAGLFPDIELIRMKENTGFAGGCNAGMRHFIERGAEFVFLLNADAAIDPGALDEALVVISRRDSRGRRAGIVGCHIRIDAAPQRRTESVGAWIHPVTGRVFHRGHGRRDLTFDTSILEPDAVSGCAMLLRAEMLQAIGFFQPDLFCYFEDVDLCLRAREAGWGVVTATSAIVRHRGSSSSGGRLSPERVYYSTRNHLAVMEKRYPIGEGMATTLRRYSILALWAAFVLRTTGMPKRQGLRHVWRGFKDYKAGRLGELGRN